MWSIINKNDNYKNNEKITTDKTNTFERSMPEKYSNGNEHLFQKFSQKEWQEYPFASKEDLKCFKDLKYGMFFHVGLAALGKVDIGWSKQTHKLPDSGEGQISDEIYDGWAKEIKMEDFDADKWIQFAKDGGMKYVVIIAKHHDGFHMWDTSYSDYKITNSPFVRDYLKELIDACHRLDVKVGLYFSQRDWHHENYEPLTKETFKKFGNHPPYKNCSDEKLPITENHKKYIEYMHNAVMELMTKYGRIDILWWDSLWWGGMFYEEMWETLELEKKVREVQPHILINNRGSVPGDFDTPECMIGYFQNDRAWESCMPLGEAWAWTGNGIKSKKQIISDLVNCACGDGNFLLSIGCMPNGDFDVPEREIILQIGKWLNAYGDSIYATNGGPYIPNDQYGSTYKENNVYIHFLNQNVKTIRLPKIHNNEILNCKSLTGEDFTLKEENGEYILTLLENNDIDTIIKINLMENIKSPLCPRS